MRWSRDDAILVLEDDEDNAITIETISIDDDDAATPPAMHEMRDISANRIC